MKGEKNGECNRTACKSQRAKMFNLSTKAWYCRGCARRINDGAGIALCVTEETAKAMSERDISKLFETRTP